jgi:hypothetical protein
MASSQIESQTSGTLLVNEAKWDEKRLVIKINGEPCSLSALSSTNTDYKCLRRFKYNHESKGRKTFILCLRCLLNSHPDSNGDDEFNVVDTMESGKTGKWFYIDNGSSSIHSKHFEKNHADVVAAKRKREYEVASEVNVKTVFTSNFNISSLIWTIKDNIPLETFDSKHFRQMMFDHTPMISPITTETMRNDITTTAALARQRRSDLWNDPEGKPRDITFTYDKWISKSNVSFTGIVAHWIDEKWKMRSCVVWSAPTESMKSTAQEQLEDLEKVSCLFHLFACSQIPCIILQNR